MTKSIYIQSITGYDGPSVYEKRAAKLTEFGFVRLRSEPGEDGKHWEIWYLYGAVAAKGPLKGKSHDEILKAVMQSVGPGTIEVTNQCFGLSID